MPSIRSITLRVDIAHTLLVTGPARVRLREGRAHCLGAPLKIDEWMTIEELRQPPLVVDGRSSFEVRLGPGGSLRDVGESTIPVGWNEAGDVVQRQQGVTVIVGEVDSGKSSLCTFLANKSVQAGLKVGLVDGDVGQADIGPPTSISSSEILEPIFSLQRASAKTSFFIGDTSPSSVPNKLIRLLVRLKNEITSLSDVVIVNTDGWIRDLGAVEFKHELLHDLKPNLVIALGKQDDVDPLLDTVRCATLRLASSSYAKTRSREERKKTREAGYRRFLLGSEPMKIGHETVTLRMFDRPEQATFQADRKSKGRLAGLLNENQELLGIGRIRDTSDRCIVVETKTNEHPAYLEIGNIVLSPRYEEVGGAL